jgi:hypothetical protein
VASPKRAGVALALVATLAACAQAPIALDEPRAVSAMPLPPYEARQECVRLAEGDRLDFSFDATEPVAFEIRYREGGAVIAPLVRDVARSDAGVFLARLPRVYCLVWEAGVAGTLVDYRLRLRPAVP